MLHFHCTRWYREAVRLCENQEKHSAPPVMAYSGVNIVARAMIWSWNGFICLSVTYLRFQANKRQTVCKAGFFFLFLFEGYKISVWIFHLPRSQLFVAADFQNKHNAGRIEEHANRHPGHPPHPQPQTFTGDVCGSVTFGSDKPDADITHQPQPWMKCRSLCTLLLVFFHHNVIHQILPNHARSSINSLVSTERRSGRGPAH